MSTGFDWQTEETVKEPVGWDEPSPEPARPSSLRRHWGLLAALGVLAIIAGFVVWRQIDRRVDEATQALQADVVGSVNLVHRAVQSGDEELFRSLLSGRSVSWTQANLDLFERDLVFDRRQLGMVAGLLELPLTVRRELDGQGEQTAAASTIAVTLSPDLTEAEVVGVQPYLVSRGTQPGGTETVWLRQTAVYRRGEQGWLLSPPLREFWGSSQIVEGERLDVIYPERDGVVAGRLAADLDALLVRVCSEVDNLDCPADWHVTLRLERDPGILVELNDRWLRAAADGTVELPTPTLVGLPVDEDENAAEAGYQALLRMYGSRLLRSVLGELTGYDCCRQMLFYRALVDRLLSELGVQAWPVTPVEYVRLLDERVRLENMIEYWWAAEVADEYQDEHRPWELYTFVDYLLRSLPEASVVEMIGWLGRTDTLNDWMGNFLLRQARQSNGVRAELEPGPSFDRDWWLAAYRIANGIGDTLPEQSSHPLYLSCVSRSGPEAGSWFLRRFRPNNTWETVYQTEGSLSMRPLPEVEQLSLLEYGPMEGEWKLRHWMGGQLEYLTQNSAETPYPILDEMDPSGRYQVVYSRGNADIREPRFPAYLLDFGRCEDGNCLFTPIDGPLRWSPDGTYAIYVVDEDQLFPRIVTLNHAHWGYNLPSVARRPLYLGSGAEIQSLDQLELLGEGYAPFWIDESNYGFLRVVAPGNQEVVLGAVGEEGLRPLISTADLHQLLNETGSMELSHVVAHPMNPDLLFLLALNRTTRRAYLFSLDRLTHQLTLRLRTEFSLSTFGFSPDGRYLVVTEYDSTDPNLALTALSLHEIASNKTIPFLTRGYTVYDWSPDGKWLAFVFDEDFDENLLTLVAPDEGYVHMMNHGYGFCSGVGWLKE